MNLFVYLEVLIWKDGDVVVFGMVGVIFEMDVSEGGFVWMVCVIGWCEEGSGSVG